MSRIRAVILDFDGVVVESNAEKDAAFAVFFSRYPEHAEAMRAYHIEHHAKPRRAKFSYFASDLLQRPDDTDLVEQMACEFSQIVFQKVVECPAVPGAVELLEACVDKVPLYISSVTPQEELLRIISARGLAEYFVEAFGDPPVPKPEAIARVLAREGLTPGEVAFVGDSLSDHAVASAADLFFYGRDSGQSFGDLHIDLYEDLHTVLGDLSGRL
jgi:phosphoglycolate phosphatase